MSQLKLVSFNLCPFVQRSVITLEEKGADYQIEYIDLANKPEWFLKISPFGKVPLLQVGDTVLFESAVINEYLEEVVPGNALHPSDPLKKAHNRSWIEFSSSLLMDGYMLSMAPNEEKATELAETIKGKFKRLEEHYVGPFFNGSEFSLVDSASAPMLQRIKWCENVKDLGILSSSSGIGTWADALFNRDSVKKSTVADIEAIFVEYMKGRGSPTRHAEPSWLGTL